MERKIIDCGDGVYLRKATQEDVDWVESHLREGDAKEHAFAEGGSDVEKFRTCWAVLADGYLVGYLGGDIMPHESAISRRRFVFFLSTTAVERIRVKYVRKSRDVLRAFARTAPKWVDEFVTVPLADYTGAVRWLERTLGFRRTGTCVWKGAEFLIYSKKRKELED